MPDSITRMDDNRCVTLLFGNIEGIGTVYIGVIEGECPWTIRLITLPCWMDLDSRLARRQY